MTEMAIQTQKQSSSLNGRLKHERNMETDTNNYNNRKLSEMLCKRFTRAFSFQWLVFRTEPVSPPGRRCVFTVSPKIHTVTLM